MIGGLCRVEPEDFRNIMCKETDTRFDICRMFLATLQLANNGNVSIFAEPDGAATTSLRVNLLSREMHAARVADYKAPSFGDTHSVPPPSAAAAGSSKSKAKAKGKGKGKGKAKPKPAASKKAVGVAKKGPALAEVNQSLSGSMDESGGGVKRKTRATRSGPAAAAAAAAQEDP